MTRFAAALVSVSAAVSFLAASPAVAQELVVELASIAPNKAGTECIFKYRTDGLKRQTLALDLKPPCMFAEPTPGYVSSAGEGDATGDVRKASAWRFGDGTLVIPIIGDPVPPGWHGQKLYQLRQDQGLTCGASLQGVLIDAEGIRVSQKREHVGVFCKELGVNAKEAWLLATPQ